jgi:hypothetical protein
MQVGRPCRRCVRSRKYVLSKALFTTISTVTLACIFLSRAMTEHREEMSEVFIIDPTDLNDARLMPTVNVSIFSEEFFNTTHLACPYPKLTIDNQEIWQHLKPVNESKPECEKTKNWVHVSNG